MSIDKWLERAFTWSTQSVKRTQYYKTALEDVFGIVQLGYSKKSNFITAAYYIHHPDFDRLAFGKVSNGGMLIIQCGFVSMPFHQKVAEPGNLLATRCMLDTIGEESQILFDEIDNLAKVYQELSAALPRFSYGDPRSPSLREMFSAIVAYLIGREWRHHIRAATEKNVVPGTNWIDEVSGRLERGLR